MAACKSRAQRGDGICKACLVHGNHVHIAFAKKHRLLPAGFCDMKPIKVPAFIEDHCLRGIQILGLSIPQDAASKADYPAGYIHDRIHHPVTESVIHSSSVIIAK